MHGPINIKNMAIYTVCCAAVYTEMSLDIKHSFRNIWPYKTFQC